MQRLIVYNWLVVVAFAGVSSVAARRILVTPQHVIPEVGRISTIFHFYSACLANRFAFVRLTFVHNSLNPKCCQIGALSVSGVFNSRAWPTLPEWPDVKTPSMQTRVWWCLSERVAHKGMAQFQEMMRQQLESSMDTELEKLVDTVSGTDRDVCKKDFKGFKNLFHRFLQVKGPSVEWIKIKRPPEDSYRVPENKTFWLYLYPEDFPISPALRPL
ncbi:hypothetical protein XENOCAPTIV_011119 [Xenoophorus captivus]|uniref:Uncharacterized protein n=1 Tax=Xenoophorus captivus TaxID=1517983 RepID=A0ABV0S1V6_9TELE